MASITTVSTDGLVLELVQYAEDNSVSVYVSVPGDDGEDQSLALSYPCALAVRDALIELLS